MREDPPIEDTCRITSQGLRYICRICGRGLKPWDVSRGFAMCFLCRQAFNKPPKDAAKQEEPRDLKEVYESDKTSKSKAELLAQRYPGSPARPAAPIEIKLVLETDQGHGEGGSRVGLRALPRPRLWEKGRQGYPWQGLSGV